MISEMRLLDREFARRPVEDLAPRALTPIEALEDNLINAGMLDPETPAKVEAMIGHILQRYHAVHMLEFPEAIALARKVERVHRDEPDCPHGLADHLAIMADELAGHQHKEEAVLFPMMLNGGGPMVKFPIARMAAEHDDVEDQLVRLAALTKDYTAPSGACGSWRALCAACRKLDVDLREHMRLENDVLFAHFL